MFRLFLHANNSCVLSLHNIRTLTSHQPPCLIIRYRLVANSFSHYPLIILSFLLHFLFLIPPPHSFQDETSIYLVGYCPLFLYFIFSPDVDILQPHNEYMWVLLTISDSCLTSQPVQAMPLSARQSSSTSLKEKVNTFQPKTEPQWPMAITVPNSSWPPMV